MLPISIFLGFVLIAELLVESTISVISIHISFCFAGSWFPYARVEGQVTSSGIDSYHLHLNHAFVWQIAEESGGSGESTQRGCECLRKRR